MWGLTSWSHVGGAAGQWGCVWAALGCAGGPQGGAVSYQLLRGWQPQNEMFFIWKKWLQCWN